MRREWCARQILAEMLRVYRASNMQELPRFLQIPGAYPPSFGAKSNAGFWTDGNARVSLDTRAAAPACEQAQATHTEDE